MPWYCINYDAIPIICSANKVDPTIFLHRIHKYLVNPRFKMKYWGQEGMKACFYAFVLH